MKHLKQNKKLRIILIVIAVIIVVAIFGILFYLSSDNTEQVSFNYDKFDTIKICKSTDNCNTYSSLKQYNVSLDYKNEELQSSINKMNENTKKFAESVKETESLSDSKCDSVRDLYYYRYNYYTMFYEYTGSDYISILANRVREDLCSTDYYQNKAEPEVIIFDRKQNKIITQEEFKKALNISEEEIQKVIENEYNTLGSVIYNNNMKYTEEITDYKLFYDEGKKLRVIFYCKDVNGYEIGNM